MSEEGAPGALASEGLASEGVEERAEAVFFEAVERQGAAREAFIASACEGDRALEIEVRSLLKHHAPDTIFPTLSAHPAISTGSAEAAKDIRQPTERERSQEARRQRWRRKRSLLGQILATRRWRLLGVLAAMIGFGGLGLWTWDGLSTTILRTTSDDLESLLDTDVLALQLFISDARSQVTMWASDPVVRVHSRRLARSATTRHGRAALRHASSGEALRELFTPFMAARHGDAFALLSPNGVILSSSEAGQIGVVLDARVQAKLPAVFAGETLFLPPGARRGGSLLPGMMRAGRPLSWVAAPVVDARGGVIAALAIGHYADRGFMRILEVARMGDTGELYAFDANGMMLSNPANLEALRAAGLLPANREIEAALYLSVRDPGAPLAAGAVDGKRKGRVLSQRGWPLTAAVKAALAARDAKVDGLQRGRLLEPYRNYRGVEVVGVWRWLGEANLGIVAELEVVETERVAGYFDVVFWAIFGTLLLLLGGFLLSTIIALRLREEAGAARRLGQYTLIQKLGEGGMGEVFLAHHALLKRPTAIKLVKEEAASPKTLARFEREVQLASRLAHPNTIAVYDFGRTDQGTFYYAMEYLDGLTLHDLVRRDGPLPAARVAHIMSQICGSLAEAHGIGMLHRDIKPLNIMVCDRGGEFDVVKVLDFGLAKDVMDETAVDLTNPHHFPGTPSYMAPERLSTPDKIDHRVDIYAVGAVAWELLAGHRCFDGEDPFMVFDQVLNEEAQPPSEVADVAEAQGLYALEGIIMSCLEKDPDERPDSMREILGALERVKMEPWSRQEAESWWRRFRSGKPVRDTSGTMDIRGLSDTGTALFESAVSAASADDLRALFER